jgi:hypothetical protein
MIAILRLIPQKGPLYPAVVLSSLMCYQLSSIHVLFFQA